jgi:hypothetical protein
MAAWPCRVSRYSKAAVDHFRADSRIDQRKLIQCLHHVRAVVAAQSDENLKLEILVNACDEPDPVDDTRDGGEKVLQFLPLRMLTGFQNEGAAIGESRILAHDVEAAGNGAGRVADHRVANRAHRLRGVLPGLVSEMRWPYRALFWPGLLGVSDISEKRFNSIDVFDKVDR